MGANTEIAWCHHTFSPWEGCQKIAPECANCYAAARDRRFHAGVNWGPGITRLVREIDSPYWRQPLKWAKDARAAGQRKRVFCMSLGDLLETPMASLDTSMTLDGARQHTWELIEQTADILDWLVLTKRPENADLIPDEIMRLIWFGTSAGCYVTANKNIPELLRRGAKARVRFVSCEPMLGPVDLRRWMAGNCETCGTPLHGAGYHQGKSDHFPCGYEIGNGSTVQPIDWVICGGESGPGARTMDLEWARSLRDQCKSAGVPFFMKQICSRGGPIPFAGFPTDLQIREYPNG